MRRSNLAGRWSLVVVGLACSGGAWASEKPVVSFTSERNEVRIAIGGEPFATYVFRDATIPRPYFAHVRAPGGNQVTRNHPPVEGKDPTDHASYHPGIWLAFGDIDGADFWRNRAQVKHVRFVTAPEGGPGRGGFSVLNHYESDGRTVCEETCRYAFETRPQGYLLTWDSEFRSDDADFTFGDQEEMGLGVRVATPISVAHGGRILNSDRLMNEKGVWGKQARWCDYSGTVDGDRIGMLLMPNPANFRPSWFHARDYGLLLANPFGRNAFTQGPKSAVTIKRGVPFRLRFGVLIHGADKGERFDPQRAYQAYLASDAEGK